MVISLIEAFGKDGEADFNRKVLETIPLSVVVLEVPSLRMLWCNRAAAEALGYENRSTQATPVDMLHPQEREAAHQAVAILERGCSREFTQMECRLRHANGTWRWHHFRLAVLEQDGNRIPTRLLCVGGDISELKAAHEEVEREATRDPLTGIFNRRRFLSEMEAQMARHKGPMSLCVCDIDHFKTINDTYGHAAGDRALQGFAQLMSGLLRHDDVVARLGGDEFCLLLPGQSGKLAARAIDRIRRELNQQQFVGKETHFSATASFGIAEFRPGMTALEWLAEADEALYSAKREGRDRLACSQDDNRRSPSQGASPIISLEACQDASVERPIC